MKTLYSILIGIAGLLAWTYDIHRLLKVDEWYFSVDTYLGLTMLVINVVAIVAIPFATISFITEINSTNKD